MYRMDRRRDMRRRHAQSQEGHLLMSSASSLDISGVFVAPLDSACPALSEKQVGSCAVAGGVLQQPVLHEQCPAAEDV